MSQVLTDGNDTLGAATSGTIYFLDGNDFAYSDTLNSPNWYGGLGDDFLSARFASGTADIMGGQGDDGVVGGNGNDRLYGEGGNDLLVGHNFIWSDAVSTGAITINTGGQLDGDYLDGGQGRDALYGLDGNDALLGGDDSDSGTGGLTGSVNGSVETYTLVVSGLYGGNGNDYLDGGRGNDSLEGGADNDTLLGGQGADTMRGDDGLDLIWADQGADNAYGGNGNDTIYSGVVDGIAAFGEAGNDQIATGNGIDYIDGGANDDILFSGVGNDVILGGTGNDAIAGYFGNDVLTGGAGTDYFNMTFDVRAGEYDTITDWSLTDDFLYLPSYMNVATAFGDYAGGAYAICYIGTSYYAVYAAGATAADLQASTFFV